MKEEGGYQFAILHCSLLTSCGTPPCSNFCGMSTFNIYLLVKTYWLFVGLN